VNQQSCIYVYIIIEYITIVNSV